MDDQKVVRVVTGEKAFWTPNSDGAHQPFYPGNEVTVALRTAKAFSYCLKDPKVAQAEAKLAEAEVESNAPAPDKAPEPDKAPAPGKGAQGSGSS